MDLQQGLGYLRNGSPTLAIGPLVRALKRQPGQLRVAGALATAALLSGDVALARRTLLDYTSDHPQSAAGWRLAAQLEWRLGAYRQAVDALRRGLRQLPCCEMLLRQLDLYEAAIERRPAAKSPPPSSPGQDLLESAVLSPATLDALLDRADPKDDRPLLLALAGCLERLLARQPNHADRHLALARIHAQLGDDLAALKACDAALLLNPQYVQALRLRTSLLSRAGRYQEALGCLRILLGRGLNWPDLHVEAAQLEQQLGNPQRARAHLYQALQQNPDYRPAHELLGKCAA